MFGWVLYAFFHGHHDRHLGVIASLDSISIAATAVAVNVVNVLVARKANLVAPCVFGEPVGPRWRRMPPSRAVVVLLALAGSTVILAYFNPILGGIALLVAILQLASILNFVTFSEPSRGSLLGFGRAS